MYVNLAFTPFYGDKYSYYKYIFILSLITFTIILMLKSSIFFIIQVIMLFGLAMIGQIGYSLFATIFAIMQIAFSLWIIYKMKQAINYNYQLVLEKTHLIEREITENDYTGTRN